MAKYCGAIGYGIETKAHGVTTYDINEKVYCGDVLRNYVRAQNGDGLNDDIKINNQISVVGDPYAFQNVHNIKYVTWMGIKWKVSSVDIQYPRLILSIGSEYNG